MSIIKNNLKNTTMTVTVEVKVKLSIELVENAHIDDVEIVLWDMDYDFTSQTCGATITDTEIIETTITKITNKVW